MGLFSSLKRLLFASESVAKSAVEKSTEYVKEQAVEATAKAKETFSEMGEKTSGLRESIIEKASHGMEVAKEAASDFGEKTMDFMEDLGDKAKEVATKVDQKIDATLEDLSHNESVKKAMDFTEDIGSKVMDSGSKIVDKAKA